MCFLGVNYYNTPPYLLYLHWHATWLIHLFTCITCSTNAFSTKAEASLKNFCIFPKMQTIQYQIQISYYFYILSIYTLLTLSQLLHIPKYLHFSFNLKFKIFHSYVNFLSFFYFVKLDLYLFFLICSYFYYRFDFVEWISIFECYYSY